MMVQLRTHQQGAGLLDIGRKVVAAVTVEDKHKVEIARVLGIDFIPQIYETLWCTLRDSNPQPLASKASTLSS